MIPLVQQNVAVPSVKKQNQNMDVVEVATRFILKLQDGG
jgi:hypothetical protein